VYLLDFSQVIFAGQCYTKLNHWVLHRGWPKMDFTISAVKWNSQKINFLFLPKNKQKRSTIFSRKWKKANIFHTELSGTAWLMQSAVIYLCRLITNLIHVKRSNRRMWVHLLHPGLRCRPVTVQTASAKFRVVEHVDCSWLNYEALHASAELKHSLFSVILRPYFYGKIK